MTLTTFAVEIPLGKALPNLLGHQRDMHPQRSPYFVILISLRTVVLILFLFAHFRKNQITCTCYS